MKFLVVFVILLCLGSTGFMFIYFDSKIKKYKRNILTLNNQIDKIKAPHKQSEIQNTNLREISIYYKTSEFEYAVTQPYTNVYLAPINNSLIVNRLKDAFKVKILDECEINKETWYFVELGLNSGLNNKGWIKKSRFSIFINKEINLPNK